MFIIFSKFSFLTDDADDDASKAGPADDASDDTNASGTADGAGDDANSAGAPDDTGDDANTSGAAGDDADTAGAAGDDDNTAGATDDATNSGTGGKGGNGDDYAIEDVLNVSFIYYTCIPMELNTTPLKLYFCNLKHGM